MNDIFNIAKTEDGLTPEEIKACKASLTGRYI